MKILKKRQLAPIVLFAYNRPLSIANLLNSLSKNALARESVLYIYADGPKAGATEEDLAKIAAVRTFIASKNWCKETHVIESDVNRGCGPAIINGVTEVVNRHGSVIVIEDDVNLSPFFLDFMNDALNIYQDKLNVSSIGSCNFFACGNKFPESFFIQYPDCMGWATWANRWCFFEPDAKKLLISLKERKLIKAFNGHGAFDMEGLLIAQVNSYVSAWDVQWTATCILNNWFTLYPNPSLCQHIALEESTHVAYDIAPPLAESKIDLKEIDVDILPHVRTAMKLGYSGRGDFYGNKMPIKREKNYYMNQVKTYLRPVKKAIKSLISR